MIFLIKQAWQSLKKAAFQEKLTSLQMVFFFVVVFPVAGTASADEKLLGYEEDLKIINGISLTATDALGLVVKSLKERATGIWPSGT